MKDRLEIIALIDKMIVLCKSAEEIVDTVISELKPENGEECPVCGICP